MKLKIPFTLLASSLVLAACTEQPTTEVVETAKPETSNFETVYQNIKADDLAHHTKVLSSDEFEGRLPATPGEKKTLDYLVNAFAG